MVKHILHILFLFTSSITFGQDMLVKRDSSKIEVKLLEIRPTEIKYKYFNYQEGPTLIINKNDVAYLIYSNGISERVTLIENTNVINTSDNNTFVNPTPPKGSIRRPDSIANYIKFSIQVGAVVYNSFSNVPRRNSRGTSYSDTYKPVSTKENVAFNMGFNFIFGKSPYVKHVIGINYLRTKSEYYDEKSYVRYYSYSKNTSYVDFINLSTGLRFAVFKKIHLEPMVTLNVVSNSKTTHTGAETTIDPQTYVSYDSSFENESTHTLVETTISLSPKISYELPVKQIKIEIYAAYNIALQYRLPWYQFGVHIFPFKKLR